MTHGNKTDEGKIEKDSHVQKDEYIKSSENVCNLDEIREQVAVMLLTEDSKDQNEKKITRLQLILQLLEEEKVEQSMGKEEPAGGGMPIRKYKVFSRLMQKHLLNRQMLKELLPMVLRVFLRNHHCIVN